MFFDNTNFLRLNPWTPLPDFSAVHFNGKVGIGTDNPQYKLDVENGDAHFSRSVTIDSDATIEGNLTVNSGGTLNGFGTVPLGGIIMWSGTDIPDGWALCSGQVLNGYQTPDLTGRFVIGYGGIDDYANAGDLSEGGTNPGNTGGRDSVVLAVEEMPSHNHYTNTLDAGAHFHYVAIDGTGTNNIGEALTLAHHTNEGGLEEYQLKDFPGEANVGRSSTQSDHSHRVKWDGGINTLDGAEKGETQAHENRPPYYVLAFIMRVK
ncbi:tail fiber protein [Fulvivirga sp. M361]|nr:tail fiber protein [Fulvivirga sp. M361]